MKTITRYSRRIKDATDDLVIRVKPEDIGGAICRDHQKCVVAKAIMRQRKSTAKWVDVGNCVVIVGTSKSTGLRYVLSGQAKQQVRFFDDNDGRFAPCAVHLAAPKEGKRQLGERKGGKPGGRNSKAKRRRPTR